MISELFFFPKCYKWCSCSFLFMRGLAKLVMVAAMALGGVQAKGQDEPQKYLVKTEENSMFDLPSKTSFLIGFGALMKNVHPTRSSLSDKVKAESEYPTFSSPSGTTWEGEEIGSFNPCVRSNVSDWIIYAKYSKDIGSEIRPYAKFSFKHDASSSKDFLEEVHEQFLRDSTSGSTAHYYLGVMRKALFMEPELGADIDLLTPLPESPSIFLTLHLGFSYERVEWRYYKGDLFDDDPGLFDKVKIDVINLKTGLSFVHDNLEFIFGYVTPLYGEKGNGGFVGLAYRF